MACQLPLSTQTKVVNLSLTVTAPNASRDLGRLLLPTVKTVNITATPATGAAVTASQALVGTQATVTLKLLPFVAYQLLAEGADASGKVLFSGSQTYTATAAASVTLNLLPQAASGSSWPTVAA
ncbi:MAG TPA: hypothetical protein VMB23_04315, partial [Spirochaetia bacterium]|nr:hypothetical protein [Spirochaetia bacterium]